MMVVVEGDIPGIFPILYATLDVYNILVFHSITLLRIYFAWGGGGGAGVLVPSQCWFPPPVLVPSLCWFPPQCWFGELVSYTSLFVVIDYHCCLLL